MTDYKTVSADAALENDLRALVRLAIAEDLRNAVDWTTVCLIQPEQNGGCQIVPRDSGICAGTGNLAVDHRRVRRRARARVLGLRMAIR